MRESASPTGVSLGCILATPISKSGVRLGACVLMARKHATCGKPMPTTTVSRSFSSRAPAATMLSVARISMSVAQCRIGFEFPQLCGTADLFEVVRVILGRADVLADVIADAIGAFGILDIELQMRGIVVIAAEHRGWMRAVGLMDHRS